MRYPANQEDIRRDEIGLNWCRVIGFPWGEEARFRRLGAGLSAFRRNPAAGSTDRDMTAMNGALVPGMGLCTAHRTKGRDEQGTARHGDLKWR